MDTGGGPDGGEDLAWMVRRLRDRGEPQAVVDAFASGYAAAERMWLEPARALLPRGTAAVPSARRAASA